MPAPTKSTSTVSSSTVAGYPTDTLLKIGFGVIVALVFFLALMLGRSSQHKSAKNLLSRMDLARQRYQNCETERRMLTGQLKSQASDEQRIAQDDHQALVSENQLLNEDNDNLREENAALERQVDDLREELDQKDYVTDEEIQTLEDTMAMGNNTQELTSLLEDYRVEGAITKDKLLEKIVEELKKKRVVLRQCRKDKAWNGEVTAEPELPDFSKVRSASSWASWSPEKQRDEVARAAKEIYPVLLANATKAGAMVASWIHTQEGGKAELIGELRKLTSAADALASRV